MGRFCVCVCGFVLFCFVLDYTAQNPQLRYLRMSPRKRQGDFKRPATFHRSSFHLAPKSAPLFIVENLFPLRRAGLQLLSLRQGGGWDMKSNALEGSQTLGSGQPANLNTETVNSGPLYGAVVSQVGLV